MSFMGVVGMILLLVVGVLMSVSLKSSLAVSKPKSSVPLLLLASLLGACSALNASSSPAPSTVIGSGGVVLEVLVVSNPEDDYGSGDPSPRPDSPVAVFSAERADEWWLAVSPDDPGNVKDKMLFVGNEFVGSFQVFEEELESAGFTLIRTNSDGSVAADVEPGEYLVCLLGRSLSSLGGLKLWGCSSFDIDTSSKVVADYGDIGGATLRLE